MEDASTGMTTKRSPNPRGASWPSLPDDMLVEIFCRLPARSVGRFRCASRSWAATLTSPSFVRLHRCQHAKQPGPPQLFFTAARTRFHSWQHGGRLEQLTIAGDNPFPHSEPFSVVQVLTRPCHGLVLLRCTDSHGHYVCNPSTGALLLLPDSKIPSRMRRRPDRPPESFANAVSYAMGHCPATGEYKVVRLFSLLDDACVQTTYCEVFLLDVSAHWRPALGKPPSFGVVSWRAAAFAGGRLYFLRQDRGDIVTFDVGEESFGSLAGPPGHDVVPVNTLQLTVLGERLCLHHDDAQSWDGPYHIWLLGDHEEAGEKWQHLCIEYRSWPDADRVLLLSECLTALKIYPRCGGDVKDKMIMFATDACEVFTVHLDRDGSGTRPEIIFLPDDGSAIARGCKETDHWFPMVGLVEESLVSVGRTGDEIIFSSPWRKAWSDVLKWPPARSLPPLDLVCRDWHAVIKSDRFTRLHAAADADMGKSDR